MNERELHEAGGGFYYHHGELRLRGAAGDLVVRVQAEVARRALLLSDGLPERLDAARWGYCTTCGDQLVRVIEHAGHRVQLAASGTCYFCIAGRRKALRDKATTT